MPNPGPTGPYSNEPENPDIPESGTGTKTPGALGGKVKAQAESDPTGGDVPDPNPGPKADGTLDGKVDPGAKSCGT